jgi:hypothetical protein
LTLPSDLSREADQKEALEEMELMKGEWHLLYEMGRIL